VSAHAGEEQWETLWTHVLVKEHVKMLASTELSETLQTLVLATVHAVRLVLMEVQLETL
jgi:hypothetical protein